MTPPPPPLPPLLTERAPISRGRWALHLALITAYLVAVAAIGLGRDHTRQPALSHTTGGLLLVCGAEAGLFGLVFGLAWLSSRATVDELLLRWRGKIMPAVWGLAYSVGLRMAVGLATAAVAAVLLLTHAMTLDSIQDFAAKNRPGVENVVDVAALRDNPAYLWLTLTVVSFILGGLREELWRSSFLAGMRGVWPRHFGSRTGQIYAVLVGAVIFGLAHLSMGILAAGMAGLLGVGLGLIMVFHRSIWPAALAHGFFDATSMAMIPWAMELLQHMPKH